MTPTPRAGAGRDTSDSPRRVLARGAAPGFTLLEIAIVIFIMGLMLTLAMPYIGGFRYAKLRSESRRLAGRATFLFDEAAGQKVILRLVFDIDRNGYFVSRLDPYAVTPANVEPVFAPDHSPGARPVVLPEDVRIRDVTVEGIGTYGRGQVFCQFYPEGYVDATVVHLMDASGNVMTLAFNPLTGQVAIAAGDVQPDRMFSQ